MDRDPTTLGDNNAKMEIRDGEGKHVRDAKERRLGGGVVDRVWI